jgi:hypothetical protein
MTKGTIVPVKDSDLVPDGWFLANLGVTTGLNPNSVNHHGPTVDEVVSYLSTLNFGLDNQVNDIWDCIDRAIWGIVHARHKFPGCAIGMAEGKGQTGSVSGKPHAVILIWDNVPSNPRYWDPLFQTTKPYKFDPSRRIIAFPFGADGKSDTIEPIKSLHMSRIKDKNYVSWDSNYRLYPLTTDADDGVLDYLEKSNYEFSCVDGHPAANQNDFGDYWHDMDQAFWAYIHVRRAYPGCAIGVAYGDPKDDFSTVVNVLWYKDEKGIQQKYLDPSPDISPQDKDVTKSFKPRRLFY